MKVSECFGWVHVANMHTCLWVVLCSAKYVTQVKDLREREREERERERERERSIIML